MMNSGVTYQTDLDGVDWAALKAILAEDDFDNGRAPEQLGRSFENSYAVVFARAEGRIIGKARVLSDGVCNAYIVDVWTYSPYRRRGIASTMIRMLLGRLPGQHVHLFTDDARDFYKAIGFEERGIGFQTVVGQWLRNEGGSGA